MDRRLLVNEIAPRVHNSGHWTLDGASVSQFEQHIRAIAGWPLAHPVRHGDVTMTNLIGDDIRRLREVAGRPRRHRAPLRQGRAPSGAQDGSCDRGQTFSKIKRAAAIARDSLAPEVRGLLVSGYDAGRLIAQPAIDNAADSAADQRRNPEQPELLQGPAADEQRRAGAARRVDRGVGDRNADQMDQAPARGRSPAARSRPAPCRGWRP